MLAEGGRARRAVRRGLRGAGWAAAAGVTLLTWLIGTLAAAAITSVPALFLMAGTVLAVVVWLLTCRLPQGRSGRGAAAVRLAGLLAVVALLVAVLIPLRDPVVAPATPPGAGTWRLDDGATLAHGVVRAADPAPGAAPVVALHGGPGVPDTAGLLAALGPLAPDGRDVWSYDQRGTGRSTRLADPSGYTTRQAVADLEQVRRRIDAERMVLVGHSWGAYLAAAYLAEHPDRVQQAVFLSPGALSEHGLGGQPQSRLTTAQRWAVYRLLAAPRALLAYALVQVSPAAAHALADDPEVDARQDRVYAATAPALHCPGRTAPALAGLGFYAGVVPQSWRAPPEPDVAAALADTGVPALVVKGRCDYLDWASAVEYLDAFADSRLVYLPGAGHNVHEDDPAGVVAAVRAFLAGRPVPGVLDDPGTPPADYQT